MPDLSDLDDFLKTQRIVNPPGVCRVCREVPPDIMALIDQRAYLKAWTALGRVLAGWGHPVDVNILKQHYRRHGPEGWDDAQA